MRERPILFSAPMVRALLAGTKTQTRRVLSPQPPATTHQVTTWHHPDPRPHFFAWTDNGEGGAELADGGWCKPCPYGDPGDRLWVREAWAPLTKGFAYRADPCWRESPSGRWRPSIFMPRWASRITLEITEVRVERLQDISEADAYDEGTAEWAAETQRDGNKWPNIVRAYQGLWESINGPGSWQENPWVWVVGFKRLEVEHA